MQCICKRFSIHCNKNCSGNMQILCPFCRNNLRPVRGRKHYRQCKLYRAARETTYAPSGDENVLGFVYQPFTTQKQLTPRQGTKTGFSNPSCLRPTETTYAPVRGRKLLGGFLLSFCMRLIAYDLTQEKTPYCALRVMPL